MKKFFAKIYNALQLKVLPEISKIIFSVNTFENAFKSRIKKFPSCLVMFDYSGYDKDDLIIDDIFINYNTMKNNIYIMLLKGNKILAEYKMKNIESVGNNLESECITTVINYDDIYEFELTFIFGDTTKEVQDKSYKLHFGGVTTTTL